MVIKTCRVKVLKAKKGKLQRIPEGKVIEVTEEMAEVLIEGKKAVKVDQDTPLGKIMGKIAKAGKDLLS